MANSVGCVRTNYFNVTDMEAFKNIVSRMASANEVQIFHSDADSGKVGFGSYSEINGLLPENEADREDCDLCVDDIATALMPLLPDGEAIIMHSICHEKLRYIVSDAYIITNKEFKYCNFKSMVINIARNMLQIDGWDTCLEY